MTVGSRSEPLRRRALAIPWEALLVSAALTGLAVVLWWTVIRYVDAQSTGRSPGPALPWWLIAMLIAICEGIVLHTPIRQHVHSVSLSELACVLALFFATPGDFLVGRAIGSLAALVLVRRQPLTKVIFNSTLYLAESATMVAVFHAVRRGDIEIDPRAWAAAWSAGMAAAVLSCLAVSLVIALLEGQLDLRNLVDEMVRGVCVSSLVITVALVAVHALAASSLAAVPIAVVAVMLLFAYRTYSQLSERYLSLERLLRFSHAVSSSPQIDEVLVDLLRHARTVLRAEYAEVVFLAADRSTAALRVELGSNDTLRRTRLNADEAAEPLWASVVKGGASLLVQNGTHDPPLRAFLTGCGLRDAVLVPLPGETGTIGTIMVGDRLREARSFDAEDVELLSSVANHAAMALRNGELTERLHHESLHDALTGLPNRASFNLALVDLLSPARPAGSTAAAVLIIDLVGFQRVNETLGMPLGDQVLREVGLRLAEVVSGRGSFARLGGDEFAAILPGVSDVEAAMPVIVALQQAAQRPVQIAELAVEVGAWIGMSITPTDGRDPAILLQRADAALAEAKLGGVGWHRYDGELHDSGSRKRLALVSELRRGIQEGELEVYVQPQGDLRSGQVSSVEALVRWRHPERGMLFPDEFIPLAERNGLIRALTTAVLERSVAEAGRWRQEGLDVSISVNLSARSCLTDETVEEVAELLKRYNLPAPSLVLEITESSVIRDPTRTRAVLERLNDLGARLSVDDFGTGYSSLSYLRELPVHEVKIDKSFVMTMMTNHQDKMIVRSIVDLARNLALTVVAEGVQDAASLAALRRMGCDVIQGYHLSRPMPIADFPAWLRTGGPAVLGSPTGGRGAPDPDSAQLTL